MSTNPASRPEISLKKADAPLAAAPCTDRAGTEGDADTRAATAATAAASTTEAPDILDAAPSERSSRYERQERIFEGLGVSPGIAIGHAFVAEGTLHIPVFGIDPEDIGKEKKRLAHAVEQARQQLSKVRFKSEAMLSGAAAEEICLLLDAHLQMLSGSRLLRDAERRIEEEHANAEAAVHAAGAEIASAFEAMGDAYLAARAQDVWEVTRRVIRCLTEGESPSLTDLPPGSIVLAEEITPADTALMDPRRIAGFAAVLGGAEGHAAIMARSLGIPAVLGVAGLIGAAVTGDTVIVDGPAGKVVLNPLPATLASYKAAAEVLLRRQRKLAELRSLPAVTEDNVTITLRANMELPVEMESVVNAGAIGVGLLRTEFLFMNRYDLPTEDEQYAMLRTVVERLSGHPVTARMMDIGGEKAIPALRSHLGHGNNPALGLRAIRLALRLPEVMETQLAAMLRAAAHADPEAPLRILLPMVVSPAEIIRVRRSLHQVAERLAKQRVKLPELLPKIGTMIEVPGAALAADALAMEADFFALGTNDLTMYTLAIDRSDERVADLYDPLHPAVLRLLQFTVQAAQRARIPVSVCGEMAGNAHYSALLLGLGVTELSMSANSIPRVKQRLRALTYAKAQELAARVMVQHDLVRIRRLLEQFNSDLA